MAQLDVDVRRAARVGHGPDGAELQRAVAAALRVAIALEALVVLAGVVRHARMAVLRVGVALPDLDLRPVDEPALHVLHGQRQRQVLAARHHHTAAALHACEIGVPVAGERARGAPTCRGVERTLGHGRQGCEWFGRRVGAHGHRREHQRGGGAQQQPAAGRACRPRREGWC